MRPLICKPLTLPFENCLASGEFSNFWKKSNIVPVHKNGDKQLIKDYQPVSLLPICGKLMEKLMLISVFNFIDTRNMLSVHQSGFRPGDSCVPQLILIVHEIYNAFDANPSLEVRGVFLDISKAFDRLWHKGLLYKLKCMGINRNFLKLVESFLSNRHQRVVLNGQASSRDDVKAGVPLNEDPLKQAQEVLFSNKVTKTNHPNIIFNVSTVQKSAN